MKKIYIYLFTFLFLSVTNFFNFSFAEIINNTDDKSIYEEARSSLCKQGKFFTLSVVDAEGEIYFIKRPKAGIKADFAYYSSEGVFIDYLSITGQPGNLAYIDMYHPKIYDESYTKYCVLSTGEKCPNFRNVFSLNCNDEEIYDYKYFQDNLGEHGILLPEESLSSEEIIRLSKEFMAKAGYDVVVWGFKLLQFEEMDYQEWTKKIYNTYFLKDSKAWVVRYRTDNPDGSSHFCGMYISSMGNLVEISGESAGIHCTHPWD